MGIRDLINDKFGWSRKSASLTLLFRGAVTIILLIIAMEFTKRGLKEGEHGIADLFENQYSLHQDDHHNINRALLIAVRVEEMANWIFRCTTDLFLFFPPTFVAFFIGLVGVTSYFLVTRFSEDSNRAAEHANAPS